MLCTCRGHISTLGIPEISYVFFTYTIRLYHTYSTPLSETHIICEQSMRRYPFPFFHVPSPTRGDATLGSSDGDKTYIPSRQTNPTRPNPLPLGAGRRFRVQNNKFFWAGRARGLEPGATWRASRATLRGCRGIIQFTIAGGALKMA